MMSQDYPRRKTSGDQRTSTLASLVIHNRNCANAPCQLASISQICLPFGSEYQPTDDESDDQDKGKTLIKTNRRILFLVGPILGGFILFSIIALFWYCGWNLGLILSNYLNKFPLNYERQK